MSEAGKLTVLVILLVAALILWMINGAHAQSAIEQSFWNSYYAANPGGNAGANVGAVIAQQRNTEAIINEMRAARGAPPCSIGIIGQWQGRPSC
jgi:hypothetical protein